MFSQDRYSRLSVRSVRALYLFLYIGLAAWSTQFYAFLERDRSLTGVEIGALAAVQQINNMLILPIWGMISDRYGKRKIFLYFTKRNRPEHRVLIFARILENVL